MGTKITIQSPDAPDVVRDRIKSALTLKRPSFFSGETLFRGEVTGFEFWMNRNLARTERTMPVKAVGRLVANGPGTVVEVSTHSHWFVILFLSIWSALWMYELANWFIFDPLPAGIHWGQIAVMLGFLSFPWGLRFIASTIEVRKLERFLTVIVNPKS